MEAEASKSKKLLQHVIDWPELYVVLPVTIFAITLAKWYYFFQTGYSPTISEGNLDWIVGMVPRIVQINIAIIMVSIFKQATGVWMTLEQQIASPALAIADKAGRLFLMWLIIRTLAS